MGNQSKNTIWVAICLLFLGAVLLGCKNNSEVSEAIGSDEQIEFLTVALKSADVYDIADHVVPCPSGDSDKICLQICHVPPGNPDNRHDKVLPLKASLKHLDHGGPNHIEKDYLGLCYPVSDPDDGDDDGSNDDGSNDDGSNDDGSNDDGSNDDGSNDDGSNDDGSNDDSDLPPWCLENIDIDADCDGIVDDTGEPLY